MTKPHISGYEWFWVSDSARAFAACNEKTSILVQATCFWTVVSYTHLYSCIYASCDNKICQPQTGLFWSYCLSVSMLAYFYFSVPKSLPLLWLWMLFLSILKAISSMVLCGIIQTAGPICFSHLPFLQSQSMPAVMVARLTFPPLPGFALSFLFSGSVLFSLGNQTAPGCIQFSCWQFQSRDAVIALAQPKCSWRSLLHGEHSKRERSVRKQSSDCNGSGGQIITWERDLGCCDKTICVMFKLQHCKCKAILMVNTSSEASLENLGAGMLIIAKEKSPKF